MALTKTSAEIDAMREGGALLSKALAAAVQAVKPGIRLIELDAIAERVICEGGGVPSFKGYRADPSDVPFPSTLCISVNEEVVHGLGNREIVLNEGDIVGLDIGLWYKNLCTDMAVTVPVGHVDDESRKLMQVTKEALLKGVAAARHDGTINEISAAIETHVKQHGYGIVKALVGHGVGHAVHEGPHVPNYTDPAYPKVKIQPGMCLALEPMIALGTHKVKTAKDGWTIITADGKRAAHFEVTIAITTKGVEILTPLPV